MRRPAASPSRSTWCGIWCDMTQDLRNTSANLICRSSCSSALVLGVGLYDNTFFSVSNFLHGHRRHHDAVPDGVGRHAGHHDGRHRSFHSGRGLDGELHPRRLPAALRHRCHSAGRAGRRASPGSPAAMCRPSCAFRPSSPPWRSAAWCSAPAIGFPNAARSIFRAN